MGKYCRSVLVFLNVAQCVTVGCYCIGRYDCLNIVYLSFGMYMSCAVELLIFSKCLDLHNKLTRPFNVRHTRITH